MLEDHRYIKKILPVFFFTSFVLDRYKMFEIIDIYKSLNISTITVMKNPGVLKFVPDHLKAKKEMCKHAV